MSVEGFPDGFARFDHRAEQPVHEFRAELRLARPLSGSEAHTPFLGRVRRSCASGPPRFDGEPGEPHSGGDQADEQMVQLRDVPPKLAQRRGRGTSVHRFPHGVSEKSALPHRCGTRFLFVNSS